MKSLSYTYIQNYRVGKTERNHTAYLTVTHSGCS